ncbi:LOW QUALITY PROTEIN: TIR domain-containing adapter molecule 1 [Archocentrus centrarchus]|uniref:LOW QUALITY PROTEIN: TIR domain-containing adapter molecule 1 n=1 Tax=Archocentrus centrarchus TaxID=63155 RepID=UPI0011EA3ABF|nr:LOW QUALITY PROTEIN: TIR domain-containing adapter molecule 1-like [Archocentrus centrarchus]
MLDAGSQVKLKMSLENRANQGTGLRDAFDLLVKAPSERLLSLTFQLGESPEDKLIHALCLVILQREAEALDKLQMLTDSSLAKHVAEKCQRSGGKLEDFGVHCGLFEDLKGESLAELARVFKILTEKRLCDPLLRNLAYKRALSSDCVKISNGNDVEYNKFTEEAKNVCGPDFAKWMCSPTDLKPYPYLHKSVDEAVVSQDSSEGCHCLPSPLYANPSMSSYPTHLEISMPSTALFQGDKISTVMPGQPKPSPPTLLVQENKAQNVTVPSQSSEPNTPGSPPLEGKQDSKIDETSAAMSNKSDTPNQTETPSPELSTTNISLPTMSVPKKMHESNGAEEEEEETFYALVILHAMEDADMADSMKEKLEAVIGGEVEVRLSLTLAGPRKEHYKVRGGMPSTTRLTLLLLTRNFNTRMLDLKTNTALINSINKEHKYNTVIPLLPLENCMPKQDIPIVLQTVVALEERKNFEKKIQKSLSPAKIEKQRRIWTKEKAQKQRLSNRGNQSILVQPNLVLGPPDQGGGDCRALWAQPPNIHIENANYIMIGNDSRMNVDLGGNANNEDSI